MTLFDDAEDRRRLARRDDPATSSMAAESLDLDITERHEHIVSWLRRNGPATDLEMAEAMVAAGVFRREEAARRAVRTVREEHGLMVPALDHRGDLVRHVNSTGREADCWIVGLAADQESAVGVTWRLCGSIRFCVEHRDFHPPIPTRLNDPADTTAVGCRPESWRPVRVRVESGMW